MRRATCVRRSDVEPFAFGDLEIWDYKIGPGAGASLALLQVKPGASHGQASSTRSDKYYYVLSGLVEFRVGQIDYWLTQGDLIIIPKGEWFDYHNNGPEAATLLLFHIPPFNLEDEVYAGEQQ